MSSSNNMKGMYKELDPVYPDCQGKQFAQDSMTPEYLDVSYDESNNERAQDKPMHQNTTAAMGSLKYSRPQYDDSPGKSGYGSYGVSVTDNGQSPNVERTTVNVDRADRGKES